MTSTPSAPGRCSAAAVLFVVAAGLVDAQSSQTLPRGYDSGTGGSGSSYPFNSAATHLWQWHYDSAQFNATGPILITEIYVRTLNQAQAAAFNFPSVEVTLASSPTDYSVAGSGGVPGHAANFAANLNADQLVVRPAAPWVDPAPPIAWFPLGIVTPFSYDPSLGNDFVVQIRTCAVGTTWGQSIFGATGSANQVGGNRYGDLSNCNATVFSFSNNEYVPIVRIDYLESNRLSVTQSGPGVGNLTVAVSMLSPTGYEGFTLMSGAVSQPAGSGFVLGIVPDAVTWSIFSFPYFPGNPFHFRTTDAGLFPQAAFNAGPGSVTSLAGVTVDFVMFMIDSAGAYDSRSNVVRYTFQ